MKQRLAKLKRLQTALASLQSAIDIKARLTAAKELTNVLKDIGALGYLTLKEVRQAAADYELNGAGEDDYSDNPNDENYRYADTGYSAGSHKECASSRIKDLAKDGITVKATDIEWEEIESDALIAKGVIKKPNIMENVDYQALKDQKVEAGIAYLIQKFLASVAPEPYWNTMGFLENSTSVLRLIGGRTENKLRLAAHFGVIPISDQKALARRAHVNGINTLKSRLTENKNIFCNQ
ncbi:hypothetical protein [Psychrobacter aquaticus]|uniref:Uncharacterized protein n=1 Tax=Psychrobacter aquaticus CMS 56 TaxID=1354303 RepID=U4T4X4_9GAMM|nr:hypothetical protein [Psychrobacter aquaticus]ERL55211.1 hypothetical protein M917_1944 [Psychrobacter aquaticus CMS 56]